MHWADVLASELVAKKPVEKQVFATAITPSGPIHVGNMREVLTTEAVFRATKDLGVASELIYIGDTFDPLRKVYPFLDAATYAPHVGKPLSDIPCPCAGHASYAEHFLQPFLGALHELGVDPRVLLAHEMYRSGMYVEATKVALERTSEIREIIERVSKRALPRNWIPFNVLCPSCGRFSGVVPTLYEYPFIDFSCTLPAKGETPAGCGHVGRYDITRPGGGKLPWRVDWPARWGFLGVTFEAFGKDHAAAGSSWDTGTEIAKRVYDYEPPHHTVYEFVLIKGQGAMHSSTGTAVAATDMLAMTPPAVLRFLMLRYQPERHIDFDTGLGILQLVDDYDKWEDAAFTGTSAPELQEAKRTYELAQPREIPRIRPQQVAYRHLVTVVQVAGGIEQVEAVLGRTGYISKLSDADREALRERVRHVKHWIERFAPEDVRFSLQATLTDEMAAAITPSERNTLQAVVAALGSVAWSPEAIHNAIHEAGARLGLKGGEAFKPVYKALLAKERGPRAGFFLASLDRDFVITRLAEASK
ncbi:MAG: lysine--tRNA ligase [Euryarchaeota archaeon]|nr:lysine--tRNA ligase [Euryarchaeota archaeon]